MFKENQGFLWKLIQDRRTPENNETAYASLGHGVPDDILAMFGQDVKVRYIFDEFDGLLFLPKKGSYGAKEIVLDDEAYTVVKVDIDGVIFPTPSELKKRWLVCCCKANEWDELRLRLNARLASLRKPGSPWKTMEKTVVQFNKMKFLCGEDVVFKICRIDDAD